MSGRSRLVLVTARLANTGRHDRLEDELVRRGAREAHRRGDDRIVLTVAAPTQLQALSYCTELLLKAGATPLETSITS